MANFQKQWDRLPQELKDDVIIPLCTAKNQGNQRMHGDDYTKCPTCVANREAEIRTAEALLESQYGKVTVAEYEERRVAAERLRRSAVDDDLREDCSVGIRDGEFSVVYQATCKLCGFSFEFKHVGVNCVPAAAADTGAA